MSHQGSPAHFSSAESVEPCDRNSLLIVDDEPDILKLFKMLIEIELPELNIDLAANGREAVTCFEKVHHAVVLMDLHMPVMTGQKAFQRIKQICADNGWEMPAVIFCTGYAPPEAVQEVVSNESKYSLLQKPVGPEKLVVSVKESFAAG
jgi:CheY-like chemotaxis protein